MRSDICHGPIWPWNIQSPQKQSPQNLNACCIHDGKQPFSHADLVRELCLNVEKRGGMKKRQKSNPTIISSIPLAGKCWGEIWRMHACALPTCNLANTVAHTHRFVWTLSSPFNILRCVPVSQRGRLLRGCLLSDGRIQTAHGRGVSPNGGTCEADGTSVIPAWGPTGTDWSTADDVTRCLSLFVVLSVTEDAYCLFLLCFFCCCRLQEVEWQLKETGRVACV